MTYERSQSKRIENSKIDFTQEMSSYFSPTIRQFYLELRKGRFQIQKLILFKKLVLSLPVIFFCLLEGVFYQLEQIYQYRYETISKISLPKKSKTLRQIQQSFSSLKYAIQNKVQVFEQELTSKLANTTYDSISPEIVNNLMEKNALKLTKTIKSSKQSKFKEQFSCSRMDFVPKEQDRIFINFAQTMKNNRIIQTNTSKQELVPEVIERICNYTEVLKAKSLPIFKVPSSGAKTSFQNISKFYPQSLQCIGCISTFREQLPLSKGIRNIGNLRVFPSIQNLKKSGEKGDIKPKEVLTAFLNSERGGTILFGCQQTQMDFTPIGSQMSLKDQQANQRIVQAMCGNLHPQDQRSAAIPKIDFVRVVNPRDRNKSQQNQGRGTFVTRVTIKPLENGVKFKCQFPKVEYHYSIKGNKIIEKRCLQKNCDHEHCKKSKYKNLNYFDIADQSTRDSTLKNIRDSLMPMMDSINSTQDNKKRHKNIASFRKSYQSTFMETLRKNQGNRQNQVDIHLRRCDMAAQG